MAIPVTYNLRNLAVRKGTTVMTALGIALTVAVLLTTLALVEGLKTVFAASGNPLHVLVMRKGATSELTSIAGRQMFQEVRFKNGIAKSANGDPLVSLELVQVVNLPSVDNPDGSNVQVRGITPAGIEMRQDTTRVAEGRWFQPGRAEIVVGASISKRYPDARLGNKIRLSRSEWEVVGILDGGTTATNSEIIADLNQLAADYNRPDAASSILLKAQDEVALQALVNDLESDRRLNMQAITEKAYFESQTSSGDLLKYLGIFVASIMAVGSAFAAMNTMYAAVARRAKEIGTLRVLGFSRIAILTSFLMESLLLSLLGGLIGIVLVLPLNNFTTGIGSTTFSEIAFNFRVTPAIMLMGLGFAAVMGAMGGLFPAGNAARKEILTALREF